MINIVACVWRLPSEQNKQRAAHRLTGASISQRRRRTSIKAVGEATLHDDKSTFSILQSVFKLSQWESRLYSNVGRNLGLIGIILYTYQRRPSLLISVVNMSPPFLLSPPGLLARTAGIPLAASPCGIQGDVRG